MNSNRRSPSIVDARSGRTAPEVPAWQGDSGERLERGLRYWRERLDGAPAAIELPADRARPRTPSGRGARVRGPVAEGLGGRLVAVARELSVEPSTLCLAAWFVLLERFTGQPDLVVGVPVAAQPESTSETGVAPMWNTLPIRLRVDRTASFRDLVDRSAVELANGRAHQGVPFRRIVEDLEERGGRGRGRVCQVVFDGLKTGSARAASASGESGSASLHVDAVLPDLRVEAAVVGDGFALGIDYSVDLHDEASISSMIDRFYSVLDTVLTEPGRSVRDLDCLTRQDHARISDWNDTARDFPRDRCIHELISDAARRTPDAVAVVAGEEQLSYAELEARSTALARRLRAVGVRPGSLVGHCTARDANMVIAVLAIWKAAAAYVPLDPDYPAERLNYMVADAQAAVVVTDHRHAGLFEGRDIQVVDVDEPWSPTVDDDSDLASVFDPEQVAYVIYTSGSTGRPKGVQIPHRAAVNFLCSIARRPGAASDDRVLALTTLSFDISVLELYLPLILGARSVILTREQAVDGPRLAALLRDQGITMMQATPTTYRILIESGWRGTPGLRALCGGEPFPKEFVESLTSRCDEVWNMYGPTETTVWSTCERIEAGCQRVLVGKPIDNTQTYVLDADRRMSPPGVIGELYIGGVGLARGYWDRPELTAERFVDNPFESGSRLYRTGDLCRQHPDGRLECLGRIDFQVKVRGHRIELGEIEAALAEIDGITQAAVAAVDHAERGVELEGFLVASSEFSASELRIGLGRTLAAYMVPTRFWYLDALPLTPAGKVDRKALVGTAGARAVDEGVAGDSDYVAPRDDLEVHLAAIWADLLGLPRVGIEDDFIELGGYSLLALQMAARIQEEVGIECELAQVFGSSTIAELAVALQASTAPVPRAVVPLQPSGEGAPLYCICGIHLYQGLAQLLGDQRPVYGIYLAEELELLANGADAGDPAAIRELAEAYYEVIREHCDGASLRLLGFCFGGMLAFEVAQLAERDGITVEQVVMVDATLFSRMRRDRWKQLTCHLSGLLRGGPRYLLEKLAKRRLRAQAIEDAAEADAMDEDRVRMVALDRGAWSYRPCRSYRGRVTLVRVSERHRLPAWRDTPLAGWEGMLSGVVEQITVDGPHHDIFHPPLVDVLACELSRLG